MTNLDRKLAKPFAQVLCPDKVNMFAFITGLIMACENSQKWEYSIPSEIHVNKKGIGFLGNAKGVQYKGKNIPVKVSKTCIEYHIELHF